MLKEWTYKWNPFNSDKLLAHIYRWREIKRNNPIPLPVTISIDPINRCDLKCSWCNADFILKKNQGKLDSNTLKELPFFLAEWQSNSDFKKGVETVCIGGGGESLMNKDVSQLINNCYEVGIETGIVTNGTNIDKHIQSLIKCTWVGISVDAGSSETYQLLKGRDFFDKVINNIRELIKLSSENKSSPLAQPGQGPGVSLKYLLNPKNVGEIYQAAKIAKEIGCKNMHIRPFGESWDKIGQNKDIFTYSDIEEFREQIVKARSLEDEFFKVFGITHKFDGNFRKQNEFTQCHAIFMTGVFMPPSGGGKFNFGFCCDRRGDQNLTLSNLTSFEEVANFWGSEEHWKIFDKIKPKTCPRCTYQPHNIIFENVIKENNTTYHFI